MDRIEKIICSRKFVIYLASATVAFVATLVICMFLVDMVTVYALCFALFAAASAAALARVAYHISKNDYSAEMFQVAIYQIFSCLGLLGFTLATSWGWGSFFLAVVVGGVMLTVGTRFIKEHAELFQIIKDDEVDLEKTLRFYPKGDLAGAEPDLFRPLCRVGTENLTIAEARERGYGEIAKSASEALARIYSQPSEMAEEKEEEGEKKCVQENH